MSRFQTRRRCAERHLAILWSLAAHPRFHIHYTPTYSSWLNQVERWFAYLTDRVIALSCSRWSRG